MRQYDLTNKDSCATVVVPATGRPDVRVDVVFAVVGSDSVTAAFKGSIHRQERMTAICKIRRQSGQPSDEVCFDGTGRTDNLLWVTQHLRVDIGPEIRQIADDQDQFIAEGILYPGELVELCTFQ